MVLQHKPHQARAKGGHGSTTGPEHGQPRPRPAHAPHQAQARARSPSPRRAQAEIARSWPTTPKPGAPTPGAHVFPGYLAHLRTYQAVARVTVDRRGRLPQDRGGPSLNPQPEPEPGPEPEPEPQPNPNPNPLPPTPTPTPYPNPRDYPAQEAAPMDVDGGAWLGGRGGQEEGLSDAAREGHAKVMLRGC